MSARCMCDVSEVFHGLNFQQQWLFTVINLCSQKWRAVGKTVRVMHISLLQYSVQCETRNATCCEFLDNDKINHLCDQAMLQMPFFHQN